LAHIACEEVGKIPILITAAVSERAGYPVDWGRIDRVLRSHTDKIAQVLFMDSIVGDQGLAQGEAEYQNNLKRMRSYTDAKNASLYSFFINGQFVRPLDAFNCEFFDGFRPLAHGRLEALEEMYVAPVRRAAGVEGFLEKATSPAVRSFIEVLTGDEGRKAFEFYKETGDESKIRSLFHQLIGDLAKEGG
jgi:AbiV family abortive infection protein